MNERIKELMKEAQVIYDYAPFHGDMDRDPKPLYKLDPKKFAELIVTELAQVANQHVQECEGINYGVGTVIKRHFGVES